MTFKPYFWQVNRTATLKRQLIAGVFVAILLVINIAKIFHNHVHTPACQNESSQGQVVKNSSCAACEFTFAKNAELPSANPVFYTIVIYFSSITYYLVSNNSVAVITKAYRGPPVI